jgi:L-cysteine S-thiosulfotransferase
MSIGPKAMAYGLAAALMLALPKAPAAAQQCKPKTTGYFTQMTAASARTLSPVAFAGIIHSLTGSIGDPGRGRVVMTDPDKGNCLSCHNIPALGDQPGHGDLGPSLNGVGGRYTEAQIRQIIVDPGVLFPDTVMPAYFKPLKFADVPDKLNGKTVLSAGEVEDIIAFLKNLR